LLTEVESFLGEVQYERFQMCEAGPENPFPEDPGLTFLHRSKGRTSIPC